MATTMDELLRFMDDDAGAAPTPTLTTDSLDMMNMNSADVDDLLEHFGMDMDVDSAAVVDATAGTKENGATATSTSVSASTTSATVAGDAMLVEEETTAASLLEELLETGEDLLTRLSDDSADVARMEWHDLNTGNGQTQAPNSPPPMTPPSLMATSDESMTSSSGLSRQESCSSDHSTLSELMAFTPMRLPPPCTPDSITRSPNPCCSTDEECDTGSDLDLDLDLDICPKKKKHLEQVQEQEEDVVEVEEQELEQQDDEEPDTPRTDDGEADDSMQHELELLEKETKYLEAHYDYLVSSRSSRKPQRTSIKQVRRNRTRQQQQLQLHTDNKSMRQLVAQQKVFLENFRSMLSFAPVSDIRLALMTPLESYIHLGKDFHERRRTILELREEKLDMTYKYIEEKAAGIDCSQPYQYSDVFERFGKYYSVHFAISKYEGVDVRQVVKVVYDQMAGTDDSLTKAMGTLQIRESYDQIKCNFLHQRIISSLRWSDAFEEGLPDLESNSLFLCRFAGDTAVFATDYIDRDDLHPYKTTERVRKDVSSGVVLTAHTAADGKKSVIMKRFLMTKFHVHPHNISDKVTSILMGGMPDAAKSMQSIIDKRLSDSKALALPMCCKCFPTLPPKLQAPDADPTIPQECG